MKIEHLALWTEDLEKARAFYVKYFNMVCGDQYYNPTKKFTSYFLSFKDSNTRIELMDRPDILEHSGKKGTINGLTHFAISVGIKELVNSITERLRADNFIIESEPRTTGDGYYESVILDTEGNLIELRNNLQTSNMKMDHCSFQVRNMDKAIGFILKSYPLL